MFFFNLKQNILKLKWARFWTYVYLITHICSPWITLSILHTDLNKQHNGRRVHRTDLLVFIYCTAIAGFLVIRCVNLTIVILYQVISPWSQNLCLKPFFTASHTSSAMAAINGSARSLTYVPSELFVAFKPIKYEAYL